MATVIRPCRNMVRSRRSLRRRATPLDCGRPQGSAMKTVNNAKKSTRNLSEPVVVVVVVVLTPFC